MRGTPNRSRRATRLGKHLWLVLLAAVAILASVPIVVLTTVVPASAAETTGSYAATAATLATEIAAATSTTAQAVTTTETTAPAGPRVDYSAEELEFVRLLNDYRQSKGLEPLLVSDTLTVACDVHTSDMITYDFLNHFTGCYRASSGRDLPLDGTRSEYFSTGTDPAERMIACGYDYRTIMGENLAAGQPTAAQALEALKASPTHDANLLCEDFKVIGIALVHDSDSDWGHYWTTDFGGHVDPTAHALATVVANVD